jgi:hypothetical protein
MPYFWVRNRKGQVAAEVSDKGLSVHDAALSWQLQKLKEEGAFPFSVEDASNGRAWNLEGMVRFFEQSGYKPERQDTETHSAH